MVEGKAIERKRSRLDHCSHLIKPLNEISLKDSYDDLRMKRISEINGVSLIL